MIKKCDGNRYYDPICIDIGESVPINAFNYGALPDIYDENGNLRDKFKKQIAAFNKLKEKRNKV
jgi:hypothetical protein